MLWPCFICSPSLMGDNFLHWYWRNWDVFSRKHPQAWWRHVLSFKVATWAGLSLLVTECLETPPWNLCWTACLDWTFPSIDLSPWLKISPNYSTLEISVLWGFSCLLRFCFRVMVTVFSELLTLSSWVGSSKCFNIYYFLSLPQRSFKRLYYHHPHFTNEEMKNQRV